MEVTWVDLYEGGAERVYKYLLRKLHLVTRKLLSWQKHSVQSQRKFTHVHQLDIYLVLFDKFKKRGGKCQGRTRRGKKGASAWKRRNSFCWKDFQNGRTMLFQKQRIHLIALWFKSFCLTCPQRIVTHSGCWIRNENFSFSFATVRP